MTEQNRHQIYIYDHPESKIQFLETTLAGKDWSATVIYPDQDATSKQNAAEIEENLKKRGYLVSSGVNDAGHYELKLHHTGTDTNIPNLYRELGLVRGTGHVIAHPGMPMSHLMDAGSWAFNLIERTLKDPARANGFINLVAEAFLFKAGGGNQHGKWTDMKNLLQSASAAFFFAQSATYLFIAKSDSENMTDQLRTKFKHIESAGGDITKLQFNAESDNPSNNFGHKFVSFLRRYPIEIGAFMNDVGMLAYLGHAIGERKSWQNILKNDPHGPESEMALKYINKGFWRDVGGVCTSLIGWSFLMLPRRKPQESDATETNPFARVWNNIRENPQHMAGLMTLGSSSQRLFGAKDKKNAAQVTGETIYIGGDIALMFTKNDEYGGNNTNDIEKLGTKIADKLALYPMVLGESSQQEFAHNIAQFILEKSRAERAVVPKSVDVNDETLQKNALDLEQVLLRKIRHTNNEELEKMFDGVAALLERFPSEKREEIAGKLAGVISEMPWVHATSEELMSHYKQAFKPKSEQATKLIQMRDISADIAQLVFAIPGINAAHSASEIYDVLAPYMRAQESDMHRLNEAVATEATKILTPQEPEKTHPRVAEKPSAELAR